MRSCQTGRSWGPFVQPERSSEFEKKAGNFENAFLFNPTFAGSSGLAKFHRLVLAAVRDRRGIQGLCRRCRCRKRCGGVLSASNGLPSSFVCFDVVT